MPQTLFGIKNAKLFWPVVLRDVAGTLLTSGTPDFMLRKDFGNFAEVVVTPTHDWHDPPKGTSSLPDPRWIPGIDGTSGFNLGVTFPENIFDTIGTYFAKVTVSGISQTVVIHIAPNGE